MSATVSASPWNFGTAAGGWGGGHYKGQMDEVRIFNSARSATQIQSDMASTTPDGAVGYWTFDQSIALTADDISGNTNNATLTNGPLWALRVTDNSNSGGSGLGSLRQAINEANTDADLDYIDFSIQQTATGVGAISEISVPTQIQVNEPIFIDGYSAYNSTVNSLTVGSNAQIKIGLSFSGNSGPSGV